MSITYKCDCCGKTFYTEYYAGGYIDHVVNFSDRKDYLSSLSADKAIKEIVFSGNDMRNEYDIQERLKCFCMQKSVSEDVKSECKERIENYFKFDEEQREKAKKQAEELTDCEKHYLYKELQCNFHAPHDGFSIISSLGYDMHSFYSNH